MNNITRDIRVRNINRIMPSISDKVHRSISFMTWNNPSADHKGFIWMALAEPLRGISTHLFFFE